MVVGTPTDEVVLDVKWFQVIARRPEGWTEPHYSLRTLDYVAVVAVNRAGELLLVRQFRPTLWATTLELPSGHVDPGQTPEQAARAELLEETGHEADKFESLANLSPDTGRLGNRMWVYFAGNAHPTKDRNCDLEEGITFVKYGRGLKSLVDEPEFRSALNYASVFAAVMNGRLSL
jgi:ADP-ribose pyrophosphatase